MQRMKGYGVRSYIPEKKQRATELDGQAGGATSGVCEPAAVRGEYGKSLLRRRGELVERSFAHCYETGGMRRCHLRDQEHFEAALIMWARSSEPDPAQIAGCGHAREWKNELDRYFPTFALSAGLRKAVSPSGCTLPLLAHEGTVVACNT